VGVPRRAVHGGWYDAPSMEYVAATRSQVESRPWRSPAF
jgi:hypothetical protein